MLKLVAVAPNAGVVSVPFASTRPLVVKPLMLPPMV